ncbi:LRR receptor-like serine/threonine-protein kinase [Perkinsela sp. CCAP 1560/4]|nr:LRR receptor-like serine/threonine-protein kinase [Perkinsela sp. CCAP 1560/4]|eukprot:KNH04440.1 LRR receptor-like serine/threonine-protein kinase [Perkinsela sp. CCAP 1560/4]
MFRSFIDVQRWPGMSCNSNGEVTNVLLSFTDPGRPTVDFQWLPSTVETIRIVERASFYHDFLSVTKDLPRGKIQILSMPPAMHLCDFSGCDFEGTLHVSAFSDALVDFNVESNRLQGSVEWDCLPQAIEVFNVSQNELEGSINLTSLPNAIRILRLNNNRFHGSVDLSHLPGNLNILLLHANILSGILEASNLPPTVARFSVHNNLFTGCINLFNFPKQRLRDYCCTPTSVSSMAVSIENNQFSKLDLSSPDHGIERLDASFNRLSGSLCVANLSSKFVVLKVSHNAFSGSIDLRPWPELRWLKASHNQLDGTLDLTCLPSTMRILFLSNNLFCGGINLEKLPHHLRRLDLTSNSITAITSVSIWHLPRYIKGIYLKDNPLQSKPDLRIINYTRTPDIPV